MELEIFVFLCLLFVALAHPHGDLESFEHGVREKRAAGEEFVKGGFESPWKEVKWNELAKKRIKKTLNQKMNKKAAKNVILFIGDGMGLPTVAAARVYKAQQMGLLREKTYLSWENFPHSGLSRTYSVDRITSDSAVTATAYLSGTKGNLATIGVTEKVKAKDCSNVDRNRLESILHKSIQAGKATGFVTDTRLTHASVAGSYASTAYRFWETAVPPGSGACDDIGTQLIKHPRNQKIRVMMGGGRSLLQPNTTKGGLRSDGQDLFEEWKMRKRGLGVSHEVVFNREELMKVDTKKTDYLLGAFQSSYLDYELDRDPTVQPSLEEMMVKAIEVLKKEKNGFFLFVEGGLIDKAHHIAKGRKALVQTLELDKAVAKALKMTDSDDTLVVVSADHSHTFSLGGYAPFTENILGFGDSNLAGVLDGKPYLQLTYANGPGAEYHRFNKSGDEYVSVPRLDLKTVGDKIYEKDFVHDSPVWGVSETHGGEDVSIHASGPFSHLFQTTEEQTYIAHAMMYASCVGDYRREKHCPEDLNSAPHLSSASLLMALLSLVVTRVMVMMVVE